MPVQLAPLRFRSPVVTITTRGLADAGHPELRFEVREDQVPPQQLLWLAEALAEPVSAGDRWQDGDTLRVGWSTLRFRAEDDALAVDEWSFESAAFVGGVTRLLTALGAMNDVLQRHALLDGARYPHGDALAAWAVADAAEFRGVREAPDAADSGWRFAADGPALAEPLPLWQLAKRHPRLLAYFALPPGCQLRFAAGDAVELVDPYGVPRL